MTDSLEPPLVGDLSTLIPTVVPVEAADPELVAIGERYWALAGFADGYPVWCEKVKDIDTNGWGHQKHAVAAAGVRAVVPGRTCPQCKEPLSLTSRSALQQLADGHSPACADCTESLQAAVRLVIDPARASKRQAAQVRAQAQQAGNDARNHWRLRQQEIIGETYAMSFPSEGDALPGASVRQMVATLALLRYAPSTTPIAEIKAWPDLWYPNEGRSAALLGELVRADMVKIHPSTPADALVWAPETFEGAAEEAGGDLGAIAEPKLTGSFYPTLTRYFAPYGTSAGRAVELLDSRLLSALDPANMTAVRQEDLLALVREVIAEEALRYFSNRLAEINLPGVPDNHVARLEEAANKVAEHRSLGQVYSLVWRATRAAAEAAQRNPHAPRAHMTTHAVNQFESHAQRAASALDWEIKPFGEIQGHGPAAVTRTLFFAVLDTDPIDTSLPQVRAALPSAAPEGIGGRHFVPVEGDDELTVLVNWLNAYPDSWDPKDVPDVLAVLEGWSHDDSPLQFEGRLVARAAGHLHRMYDRLAPSIGVRQAALAVLAATALLTHPLTVREGSTTGQWILDQLGGILLGLLEESLDQSKDDDGMDEDAEQK
ncbi:hypothetical protein ACIQOW_01350 [Kitasatospora sp. NPDC091335]|uniref:hypothetical protein n=1 Tax=Kitasatospora sp. NPDC091335 TaxID=3364085 RepID=UPI00381B1C8F